MELLKGRGTDIEACTWDKITPLIRAVEQDRVNAVDLLLSWGADPFAATADGDCALAFAIWHARHPAMIPILACAYKQAKRPSPTVTELPLPKKLAWGRFFIKPPLGEEDDNLNHAFAAEADQRAERFWQELCSGKRMIV